MNRVVDPSRRYRSSVVPAELPNRSLSGSKRWSGFR